MRGQRFDYVLRMAFVNTCVAVVILLLFRRNGGSGFAGWLRDAGVALVLANSVGAPMAFLMPRLGRRLSGAGPVGRWAGLLAAMAAIAIAGSTLSIVLFVGVGYLPPSAFSEWFRGSARASVVFALAFGVAVTLYETMRARLEATTLALRTKERDEAELRRLAAEAQLTSLESRVQPHFLFNTLNSIAALIPQDPQGAERMIGQLASLMRASLDAGAAPLVPLEQELRNVRTYLAIERVRFGDRLRFSVDVADDLGRTLVPVLSLQTLVENAVKYAVSSRRDGASVSVRAETHNAHVKVIVEDDGPGFDAAFIPDHHGLALLRERLRLSLGAPATVDIESRPGCTRAVVTVPR
jgi:signal transduction histidine kinase